jgi:DNA-binding GntR family transcriptional regulator
MTIKKDTEGVYEAVKQQILTMQIKPGEAVTEQALAASLGVSRTPVREALNKLEKDGLIVTNNRRKSVYVLTIQEVKDIFDLKINLEGAIARWATERGSAEDFKLLEGVIGAMKALSEKGFSSDKEEADFLEKWLELDRTLHGILFRMSGNRKAEQIVLGLNAQWHRLRVAIYAMEGRVEKAYTEHENFVKAILEKDASGAEAAMKLHLNNLKRELVKILNIFHYPS